MITKSASKIKLHDKVHINDKILEVTKVLPGFGRSEIVLWFANSDTLCVEETTKLSVFEEGFD
jgi:hypothetical protein